MASRDRIHLLVLPWLGVDTPQRVLDLDILPATTAIERAGIFSDAVRAATSYFFDSHRVNSLDDPSAPTQLVPVEPSVILLSDEAELERASLATDCLFFAVLFDNSIHRYANGTNFVQFYQSVSRDFDGFGRQTRAMFGSRRLATRPENAIEVRPLWCGDYHPPNDAVLSLCESAMTSANAGPLRECFRALIPATFDSDAYERDLEQSLYALALERLLHRKGQRNGRRSKQRNLSRRLLSEHLSATRMLGEPPKFDVVTFDLMYPTTNEILEYIRDERNDFWHPERSNALRPLSAQLAIAPHLVAFRALSALVLLCMADATEVALDPLLSSYIAAVEHWCVELPIMYQQRPEEPLTRFGRLWMSYNMRNH